MSKFNYCEFFRFNDKYCDVFEEEGHYLYCEAESFDGRPGCITCKEYTPAANGPGYIVSCYAGAAAVYLQGLKYAMGYCGYLFFEPVGDDRYTCDYVICYEYPNSKDPKGYTRANYRRHSVHYTLRCRPYINRDGRRIYLDDVLRVHNF